MYLCMLVPIFIVKYVSVSCFVCMVNFGRMRNFGHMGNFGLIGHFGLMGHTMHIYAFIISFEAGAILYKKPKCPCVCPS